MQRRIRLLLNVIDHLPPTSHLAEAIGLDEDLAGELADDQGPQAPPLRTWTAEVDKLAAILDRLGELIAVTSAAASGKRVKPPRPCPRPVLARQRVARRRRWEIHNRIVEQVLADRG